MATLDSFSPSSATPGQIVTILGSGFTGATAVKFGGVDAIFFRVVDDNTIQAYPNYLGTGTITVSATDGDVSLDGFTLILTRVKLPDLPALGRAVGPNDLQYVWDILRNKLCNAPNSAFPGGTGGGGGDTGNIFTALGSPFKVRNGDEGYTYDSDLKSVIITDVRLLGKQDYIVNASDVSNEFENFNPAVTSDGSETTADDGKYVDEPAVNISGSGTGATFTIKTVNNVPVLIIQTALGSGYTEGDTFSIDDLPGIVFTLNSITGDVGNLVYDDIAGSVTIVKYQLADGRHVSIHADGVVTAAIEGYITTQKAQIDQLMLVAAPFLPSLNSSGVLTNPGGLVIWFRPAIEIPTGWAEWVPGRGNDLRGQDPSDVYDADTNPDGLSRPNGTQGGSLELPALAENNIPLIKLKLFSGAAPAGNAFPDSTGIKSIAWSSNHLNGNQDYDMKGAADDNPSIGHTSTFGQDTPDPLTKSRDPFRIVNFIYSTQTA